jgi:protein-S-isoprenylcysteine O-methyltransferase Ste14
MSSGHDEHKKSKIGYIAKRLLYSSYLDLWLIVLSAVYAFHQSTATFFYFACLFLTLASFVFWVISWSHLGNTYSDQSKTLSLVTTGVYSKIRHPMYFFSSLTLFFIALYINSLLAYVFLAIIILSQLEKMNMEDKMLEDHFGAEYLNYKEGTWF